MKINVRGRLFDLSAPRVMGILNATPDSFYKGSRVQTENEIAQRVEQMIAEGADIIDVGGFSTRPGAEDVSVEEEIERLKNALKILRSVDKHIAVSVDTFRPDVAQRCIEDWGADIINDVGDVSRLDAGARLYEDEMFKLVARLGVPYILMSLQSNITEMIHTFSREVSHLKELGVKDIILDPGYGFGKKLQDNFSILHNAEKLKIFELPVLIGLSRKSIIYKVVGGDATTALNGTAILNTVSLMKGANILRVHDVKEAVEAVKLYSQYVITQ